MESVCWHFAMQFRKNMYKKIANSANQAISQQHPAAESLADRSVIPQVKSVDHPPNGGDTSIG